MIDIENYVINAIDTAFGSDTGRPTVVSILPKEDGISPLVYVRMLDNSTYERSLDQALTEHHARISFRIECYSNSNSAKQEVKDMIQTVDATMQSMKFTRTSYGFIPNINPSYTRAYADYYAIVGQGVTTTTGKGKKAVTTTTHRMYRK